MRRALLAGLLALGLVAPAAAAAPQPQARTDELLTIDVATGKVTRLATPQFVMGSCWGAQRLELLVERARDRAYVTYRPGRPPQVVHRPPNFGAMLLGADYAPGCGRVAESYMHLPGDPQTGSGVLVRDAGGHELFRLVEGGMAEDLFPLAWSADGSLLAVAMYEGDRGQVLHVVDGVTGAVVRRHVPANGVAGIDAVVGFSADNTTLTYDGDTGTGIAVARRVLDLRTGATTAAPAPDPFADTGVLPSATSPDGSLRAFTTPGPGGGPRGLAVVEQRPGAKPRTLLRRGPLEVRPLEWSPDGRTLAVVRHEPY